MNSSPARLKILVCGSVFLQGAAIAGESQPIAQDADSLLKRDTLTGDWFGVRDTLADQRLITEFSTTGCYAGVFSGGRGNDEADFGGRVDTSNRLAPRSGGLWPRNAGVVPPTINGAILNQKLDSFTINQPTNQPTNPNR
jgi:hypothetical protein